MSCKKIISLCLFCLLLGACNSEENKSTSKSFESTGQDWQRYMNEIGIADATLSNTVFLMMRSTACSPCINELAWWNKNNSKLGDIKVKLIVLEKYKKPDQVFLDRQNVSIPSHRDSNFYSLTEQLIPTTPFKVFIDEDGKVSELEHIGANGNLKAFVEKITKAEVEEKS